MTQEQQQKVFEVEFTLPDSKAPGFLKRQLDIMDMMEGLDAARKTRDFHLMREAVVTLSAALSEFITPVGEFPEGMTDRDLALYLSEDQFFEILAGLMSGSRNREGAAGSTSNPRSRR